MPPSSGSNARGVCPPLKSSFPAFYKCHARLGKCRRHRGVRLATKRKPKAPSSSLLRPLVPVIPPDAVRFPLPFVHAISCADHLAVDGPLEAPFPELVALNLLRRAARLHFRSLRPNVRAAKQRTAALNPDLPLAERMERIVIAPREASCAKAEEVESGRAASEQKAKKANSSAYTRRT
eukprot:scaffold1234_cov248-Pinguiococcus_pyrenoidosus.AAC.10